MDVAAQTAFKFTVIQADYDFVKKMLAALAGGFLMIVCCCIGICVCACLGICWFVKRNKKNSDNNYKSFEQA